MILSGTRALSTTCPPLARKLRHTLFSAHRHSLKSHLSRVDCQERRKPSGQRTRLRCVNVLQPRVGDMGLPLAVQALAGASLSLERAERAAEQLRRRSLLPIGLEGNRIVVGDGAVVLSGVTPLATQRSAGDFLTLSLQAPAGPVSTQDYSLGVLHCKRWLCCARNKLWWMTPEWGSTSRDLPPETQFLLLELEDGTYAIILPLIDQAAFRGTLRPPRKGTSDYANNVVTLRMESGDDDVLTQAFGEAVLVAAGRDPFVLVEEAVVQAAARSGGARPLHEKQLPPNVDVFGWCSWDSFYSAVSASGLSDAVQSLSSGGTPPRWVVIDDGWQCTEVDEPYRAAPTEQLADRLNLPRKEEGIGREAYIEGEMEVIGQVAKEIPAGSSIGTLLEELRASEDANLQGLDYYSLSRQHATKKASSDTALEARPKKQKRMFQRIGSTVFQYLAGLVVGAVQAVVVLFYQWVVDPADYGTWPVRLFAYLTAGPLRGPMLQFFADSTNFTRRLVDVRANSKFSSPYATAEDVISGRKEDLRSVVAHLRNRYGVQFVYCWHGLAAYWSGIAPDAPGTKSYESRIMFANPTPGLLEIEPSMCWNPSVLGGIGISPHPARLFNDMHSYLASAGISGVKVDCQAGIGLVGNGLGGGPAHALKVHTALEDSIARHFPGNSAINCMAHSTENIFRWRDTAVARASDDFYPTDKASHIPHIAACAFNGLFLSPIALPDWDMFQSRHVAANIHAAARAVSGGPVYVSDCPGSHSFEVLRQLVLPDGTVLRARLPGRPTRDSLFCDVLRDNTSLLKVWNMNSCTGVVGVFNLQGSSWDRSRRRFHIHNSTPPELTASVRPTDVEPFRAMLEAAGCGLVSSSGSRGGKGNSSSNGSNSAGNGAEAQAEASPSGLPDFAVYLSGSGELRRVAWDGSVDVTVKGASSVVVTMAPIVTVECTEHSFDFAPIGLANMLNGGGAVMSARVLDTSEQQRQQQQQQDVGRSNGSSQAAGQLSIGMQVKGRGPLVCYCTRLPQSCAVDGFDVPFRLLGDKLTVEVPQVSSVHAGSTEQQLVIAF